MQVCLASVVAIESKVTCPFDIGVLWGDITCPVNGGNVLVGVTYKNEHIYSYPDTFSPFMGHVISSHTLNCMLVVHACMLNPHA